MFLTHDEDQNDLEKAWHLQQERANGFAIPEDCREPKFLQYREVCRFGKQLERVFSAFPSEQVKVIVFEEWTKTPRSTYLSIMEFLGLPDDGCVSFAPVNTKRQSRSRFLSRLVHRPPKWLLGITGGIKTLLGLKRLGIANQIKRLNEKNKTESIASSNWRFDSIREDLMEDHELLEQLLPGRLRSWAEFQNNE